MVLALAVLAASLVVLSSLVLVPFFACFSAVYGGNKRTVYAGSATGADGKGGILVRRFISEPNRHNSCQRTGPAAGWVWSDSTSCEPVGDQFRLVSYSDKRVVVGAI